MKSTFRILFLARWELQKENGQVPLCVRITIDGERVKFSLKSEVSGKIWDPKSGRAKGQTKEALQLNRYLDSIKGQMITHYHRLCEANEVVTATMVRDAFLGTDIKNNTLLTVFEEFNDRQEKLIGIDLAQSTFNKYDLTYRRLKEFMKVKMRKSDILLCQVDRNFVMDFEAYLKIEYKLDTNSSEKLMRIFKRITTMCFKNGQMPKDPFCEHKLKKVKKDRGYLTKSELEKFIDFKPDNKRLEKVRDIFLFCCFTGFDYSTTAALTDKNLVVDDDGSLWIETHRIKTSVVRPIPSSSAVTLRFPFACFKARKTRSLSSASLRRAKLTGEVCFVTANSRCSFETSPVCACNTAPMIFCRSSRTLPGHTWVSNVLRASPSNPITSHSSSWFAISRKNSANGMMSS